MWPRTAQEENFRVVNTEIGCFLFSVCLKSDVYARWKVRQVLLVGLYESISAEGLGTAQCFPASGLVRAQKRGASPLLIPSVDWQGLAGFIPERE